MNQLTKILINYRKKEMIKVQYVHFFIGGNNF